MTMRFALLALSALTLPAAAFAQWNGNWPVPGAVPPPPPPQVQPGGQVPVAEPWMARPAPSGQAWQSPAAEPNKAPALEPIDLPPAIEQGVDMIYIDEELVPKAVHDNAVPADTAFAAWRLGVNPVLTFWTAYVLTRPLGASLGDLLSQSRTYGGVGLGTIYTSIGFLTVIVALVAWVSFEGERNGKTDPVR